METYSLYIEIGIHFHVDTLPQYDNHVEVLKEKLRLLKTEFEGIKDDLDRRGDKYVQFWT